MRAVSDDIKLLLPPGLNALNESFKTKVSTK